MEAGSSTKDIIPGILKQKMLQIMSQQKTKKNNIESKQPNDGDNKEERWTTIRNRRNNPRLTRMLIANLKKRQGNT